MTLVEAFSSAAAARLDKTALFWGDTGYSYAAVQHESANIAHLLGSEYQVRAGDRVGLWLKNRPEFIFALFGILQANAVAVPINNFLKPQEVTYILDDAGIDVLITDDELSAHVPALVAARLNLKVLNVEASVQCSVFGVQKSKPAHTDNVSRFTHLSRRSAAKADHAPVAPERSEGGSRITHHASTIQDPESSIQNLAVLIYTSGTTGRPKGAMLSHGNLIHNAESCRDVLQVTESDRIAVMLPMFHSYMLTVGILLPLLVGGSIVLVKSLHPIKNAMQEILQRHCTVLPAIPAFYRSIVHAHLPLGGPGEAKLPFRICVSGAAPLPKQVLKEFEERFRVPLIEGYGLSEASPVVTKNPLNGVRKPGSIGLPIPRVEVSIQDECGAILPPHEVGEVCVRGGNVMQGYWRQPDETAKVMRNGWLLTGDIGYRDEDGYFYITDRKKDMLLVNGINVYPREIEEILYQFPGVKEAAVIGKPDDRKGEQPIAYVAPREGVSLDEKAIQQYVREHLADYKVPKKIILMAALPRNATGKILKTALRQMQ